jgi:hypothetical protein
LPIPILTPISGIILLKLGPEVNCLLFDDEVKGLISSSFIGLYIISSLIGFNLLFIFSPLII